MRLTTRFHLLLIVGFLTSIDAAYCLPNPSQPSIANLQELLNNSNGGANSPNVNLVRALAQDIRSSIGSEAYNSALRETASQADQVKSFDHILSDYVDQRRAADIESAVFAGNNLLIKASIGAGTALAPETLGGSLLFAGLGVASVLAILGAVVGEFVGAGAGLGMLLLQYDQQMALAPLFAVIVLLGVIGFLMNHAVGLLERRYCFWAQRAKTSART